MRDVVDIGLADVADPGADLHRIYEWYWSHSLEPVKGAIGTGASVLAAVVALLATGKLNLPTPLVAALLVFATVPVGLFVYVRLRNMRSIAGEYAAALRLCSYVRRHRAIIDAYLASKAAEAKSARGSG